MGGTHVDAVVIEQGKVIDTAKNPTNRENLFESIWTTLQELLSGKDVNKIKRINLSTTISTNAIVEKKTSPVGMIIQSGPGLSHDVLACGSENAFISGYIDHRGREVAAFDPVEIKKVAREFKQKEIPVCAVVAKFSVRNPEHEIEIAKMLEDDFDPITMGHTVSGKLNFPRRVYTSYLNSAIFHTFRKFSNSIVKAMKKEKISAPIYVLKADGGTARLESAENQPVETILSGPAASIMGTNALLPTRSDAVQLDIGGTTTDISFLADGVPLFEPQGIQIDKYKTLVRAVYNVSIGLGGDSSIRVDGNKIKIGPKRDGYPMALGGPTPTPGDAMVVLDLMNIGDKKKAYEAMKILGKRLGVSPEDAAKKVLNTMADIIKNEVDKLLNNINSRPVYTVKELLYGKKIKPKVINIIGGPAKALASVLEEKFNIPCRYPENYHVANAVGAALSRTTTEITMTVDTARGVLSVPEMGIYENVNRSFTLDMARDKAIKLLEQNAQKLGATEGEIEPDITEESSFNMVRGFFTSGKNMRIKAQVKPGLIYQLRGVDNSVQS